MAVKPVVYDDSTKKHRPLGSGEKMDGLSASSIISSQSGNLITTGSDGLAYATGSGIADPSADNLIEATSGGKLKVDMDRIVDWLDGHSSDASALADAINVVSADSGNVIIEGTDSGAYLSKAALSNAIGSMTDAQLQALAAAIADGQTIVASGGKLIVDPTNATAAKLKKITAVLPKAQGGIVADSTTGKLYVDFDAMTPEFKRNLVLSMVDLDGGLAVHDSGAKKGTIYVDFSRIDDNILRAAVIRMVQEGGGLSVDEQGQLYVDFDSMPTDKFEAMMASLRMLVPLEANKTIYVNKYEAGAYDPGIDVSGWGESKTIRRNSQNVVTGGPFLSIQGAVSYVTAKYALGKRTVAIRIVSDPNAGEGEASVYSERVDLPEYSRGSGSIIICSDAGDKNSLVVQGVQNNYGLTRGVFSASGASAVYYLRDLTLRRVEHPYDVNAPAGVGGLVGAGSGATVYIQGCALEQSFPPKTAEHPSFGGKTYSIRLISADGGGSIHLAPWSRPSSITCELSPYDDASEPSIGLAVCYITRGSSLWFRRSEIDGYDGTFLCSGACTEFLYIGQDSSTNVIGAGVPIEFVVPVGSSFTGQRFIIRSGSHVLVPVSDPDEEYFPGDTAGSIDATTYCWYDS